MMKKFTILLFAAILSLAFLVTPAILEARGGHGGHGGHGGRGGHHGGSHGGYRYHGGSRSYGGPIFGFGAGYYPGYYYAPPNVYYPPADIEAPPPEDVEPSPGMQDPDTGNILNPPATGQIPPNSYKGRCREWAPTGEFHNESRWDPQKQTMEIVSVPNFAWQDYPCE
jgi:hypothetical protein